jgi:hypothetical protein
MRLCYRWYVLIIVLVCFTQMPSMPQSTQTGNGWRGAIRLARSGGRTGAMPDRIEVFPAAIQLDSRRAYRQLVVTGYIQGVPHDVTTEATYRAANSGVVAMHGSRVEVAGEGRCVVTVSYGGRSVQVPVSVTHATAPDPISFKFETRAVLTKQGCATGSCHGSPHGKGGFSLSLFGYDPTIDRISLTHDGYNRRVNVMDPAESLMIKKPLLEIPHVGGKRLHKNDAAYRIFTDWIYQGAHTDLPSADCDHIAITPNAGRVLHMPFLHQQLSVFAYFTNGASHDFSRIATYATSNASVATVDADGLITAHGRGQAAISVRYLDKFESILITVVEDVPGFHWNHPPENNIVDQLVDAKLQQLQYLPSETCNESVFLRRLYLDLTGMLPTTDQTRRFLADTASDKRAKLIDALLETDEYARFQALKKADLMRVSPGRLPDGRADLFAQWLIDAMRTNMPYDRFARAILTAEGDTQQVPATNYFVAIPTMEERTEMTAQIFMGTRIECTKCHNHPFENWTMRNYYSIAAVFARTQTEDGEVTLANTGEAQHPTTKEVMTPWGMTEAQQRAHLDRRAAFADWLTAPSNPYFARVEVNRIWADLLGRGIVEPVDDFRSSNPPANAPLLDALAQEFVRGGYDRKQIIRLICNSRTYQRDSLPNRFNRTDESLFSHAKMRLLTAEQLKDAMGMATYVLPPLARIPTQIAYLQKGIDHRTAALEAAYPAWLDAKTAEVTKLSFWQGGWYVAGPYPATDVKRGLAEAIVPETQAIDLTQTLPRNRKWELNTRLRDDARSRLTSSRNQVHYLYRCLHTTAQHTVIAQISANDTYSVWLNGQPVNAQPLQGEQKVTLKLRPGDNQLLVKIANSGPFAGFRYQLTGMDADVQGKQDAKLGLPTYFADLLAAQAAHRSSEPHGLLYDLYVKQDGDMRGLKQQIADQNSRMQYATQRPYPEGSEFAITFGQPKRETACTCERQHAPTLLQALELLNGGTAYRMAQESVQHYAPFDNDKLIEELYLSALCRVPTDREKTMARQYLAGATDRNRAVMDLIWTVTNTQEFLFQH